MSTSRLVSSALCVAAAGLLLLACSRSRVTNAEASSVPGIKTLKNRRPAPDFTLKDASGQATKLSDLKGKVVLLNFWATWCGPCALEIPWFEQFEQQYRSKGLEIVGVSMDEEGWGVVRPYIAEHKINYRVLLGNDSVGELYGGVDSLPTTFIIDREGRFAFPPHVGLAEKNEYLSEIQTLLGNSGPNQSTSAGLRLITPASLFVRPTE
ncbi:MAG TPA: TlpA disulfide reductase family protein [Bryobacteraceae bacterium]|nr:TlpA disulfide reductase family protein [Bryobacteraceae bacterium]